MRQLKSLLPSVNRKFIDSCTSSSISDVCALVDNMISDSCDEANELYFNVLAIAVMAKDYQVILIPYMRYWLSVFNKVICELVHFRS